MPTLERPANARPSNGRAQLRSLCEAGAGNIDLKLAQTRMYPTLARNLHLVVLPLYAYG